MYLDKPIILNILLSLWQLPQIILGLLLLLVFRNKELYTNPNNHISVLKISTGSILKNTNFSLGPFIFIAKNYTEDILLHETGHSKQSILLSWLYLIIIPIPSICLFWYRKIFNKSHEWYMTKFPENWANKLGGVNIDYL